MDLFGISAIVTARNAMKKFQSYKKPKKHDPTIQLKEWENAAV